MATRNVVLTGFMGTGKTTVGRLLADRLGYRFVDTDAWIVTQDGRSIPEIFRQDGEAVFRSWERRAAQHLAGEQCVVIATGGRLMLDPANASLLSENAHVFCLTAVPESILARVADDEERPLLQTADPLLRIRQLLAEREAGYGRFSQIPTDDKSPPQLVEEIIRCISVTSTTAKKEK